MPAAPGTERSDASAAGAWAQLSPPPPGVFRIRPLSFEATASYSERLSHAYRLTLPQLCDGLGISLSGHGACPTAGLVLSPTAASRLADLGRIPMTHLTHALPHLVQGGTPPTGPATARWRPTERRRQAVRACTMCVRHHSHGATGTAWIHRPWHRLVCVRHQQAAPDPRLTSTLYTGVVPELAAAHHAHQPLQRHPRSANAWMAARAITTRWYDHQQHLTDRWHHRLRQLSSSNSQLDPAGNTSAVLLTRDLVTYPETVALTRTLATLPRHRRAYPTHVLLSGIGHRLGLAHFSPAASDPLHTYLGSRP
ncbi:TniQ family protein [Streptomyces mauvecolor]|uniref:TniQ family protein n=1 Tax=Streptomyces mauvecolor TaxID=58345 RepID=A0ABV9USK4_9ACTN